MSRLQPLCRRGIGRPRVHRHDLQTRHALREAARGLCANAGTGAGERYAVSEPDCVWQVAGQHVRAADPNRCLVTPAAKRSHQTDAIRDQKRRCLNRATKLGVTPGQHHHLGVEGDHECRGTLGIVAVRLHHVDE